MNEKPQRNVGHHELQQHMCNGSTGRREQEEHKKYLKL